MSAAGAPSGSILGMAARGQAPRLVSSAIVGRHVATGQSFAVRDAYLDEPVALVPTCGQREVDDACKAASLCLAEDFPQYARARILTVAAEKMRLEGERFARLIAIEAGKPPDGANRSGALCGHSHLLCRRSSRALR